MTLFSVADFGAGRTGLATVGYRLYDPATGLAARITDGVVEITAGQYGALVTYPDGFTGAEVWDSGEITPVYAINVVNPAQDGTAGYTAFNVADFGSGRTGLLTAGYRLWDQATESFAARITAGVAEIVDGKYGALVTYPAAFTGAEVWDSGEVTPVYATNVVNAPGAGDEDGSATPSAIVGDVLGYRAVNYRDEIQYGIAGLLGINVEAGDFGHEQARNIAARVNSWVRKGWDYWPWKAFEVTEERAFRQIWSALLNYFDSNEVYDLTTQQYYRARADTSPGEPVSDGTLWEQITPLDRFIAFNTFGKQAIGQVIGIYRSDPRSTRYPRRLNFTLTSAGVAPVCAGNKTAWITYRAQQPVFTSDIYDPARAYKTGDLVFDPGTGDCFRALKDGTGDAISEQENWYRQRFPYLLSEYVVHGVAADLSEDMQTRASFKAEAEERITRECVAEQEQGVRNFYGVRGQGQWDEWEIPYALVEVA